MPTSSDPAEPVVDLADAHAVPGVGPKSSVLSRLLGLGLPVPPGVVVLPHADAEQVVEAVRHLGPVLAVRSSAPGEDSATSSFAGVLESVLDVAPVDVVDALAQVRRSVSSPRADAYRVARGVAGTATTAVLVQRQVDAVAAGVAFTVDPVTGADVVVVEAAAGLGDVVVGGTLDPDRWRVDPSGTVVSDRSSGLLDDTLVREIARLATQVAEVLGGPQDVEWALDGVGALWVLQARPVTTAVGGPTGTTPDAARAVLTGTAASRGRATGRARVLAGPQEHQRFSPGDVLVCRTTDPSWVPLMAVASAVVTEVGGLLAHAAIVARELGVPAVVGVPDVTRLLAHEPVVAVDGGRGEVVAPRPDAEVPMPGGMGGAVRVGGEVARPVAAWTPTVHRLLTHLRDRGLDWVPEPLGLDDRGRERVSYLPGVVPRYPLPDWVWRDEVVADAARVLAELHRATAGFEVGDAVWQVPVHEPVEVLCHNDFAPTNLVFTDGRPTGVIDWDTVSPGPRVWDLAYLAYRLVPLTDPANPDGLPGTVEERARRLRLLCDAYGDDLGPADVVPVVAARLDDLASFTAGRAGAGAEDLHGHVELYRRDARWVRAHAAALG